MAATSSLHRGAEELLSCFGDIATCSQSVQWGFMGGVLD